MKEYPYVFFDLDGTLTDPYEGITKSVQRALLHFGIDEPDREKLRRFIGPPLRDSFARFYGIESGRLEEAVNAYREYFSVKGIFENELYEGVEQLLEALVRKNVKMLLATSKPEPFAKRITEHFGIDKYFFAQCGSDFEGKYETKAQVIERALSICGAQRSEVLMVGDRMHDIIGAKENGVDSAGVLYGYGDREELEGAGADMIFASVDELKAALLSKDA